MRGLSWLLEFLEMSLWMVVRSGAALGWRVSWEGFWSLCKQGVEMVPER